MRSWVRYTLPIIAVALAALIVACGGDGGEGDATATPPELTATRTPFRTPSAPVTPTAPEAPGDGETGGAAPTSTIELDQQISEAATAEARDIAQQDEEATEEALEESRDATAEAREQEEEERENN